jgi:hypothetical protein
MLSMVRASEFSPYRDALKQKILDLHPRGDVCGVWGVPFKRLPPCSFEEVFAEGGLIEQINCFESNPSDDEEDPFPPWSSGDLLTDFLADLTYSLGSFEQAQHAVAALDLQAIANFLKRLQDLNKGSEGREKAGLKRWFWENVRQFDDVFFDEG